MWRKIAFVGVFQRVVSRFASSNHSEELECIKFLLDTISLGVAPSLELS